MMEATALCFTLFINMLVLSVAHLQQNLPQTSDVRIVPTRLQLFEYESVSFTCEGFVGSAVGWKVWNNHGLFPKCLDSTDSSSVNCTIDYAFTEDSGEYWCEGGGRHKHNPVNITITDGPVILESPVRPVTEGEVVTLRCRKKTTSSNYTAHFYKDGVSIGASFTGHMIIHSVSKADEGFYKCSTSGAGESPQSWMAVRDADVIMESPALPVKEGAAVTLRCRRKGRLFNLTAGFYKDGVFINSSSTGEMTIHSVSKADEGSYKCSISGAGESAERWLLVKAQKEELQFSRHYSLLLWISVLVVLVLQLLLLGLLHWKKQLVVLEAQMSDPHSDIYAVIKKVQKKKNSADAADNSSLRFDKNLSSKPLTEKDNDEPLASVSLLNFH